MPPDALSPEEIQAAQDLAKAQKELAWQLTEIGVNAATIVDPTGLTNIPAMGMSIYDGDFIGAGLVLIGLIPLAGKLSDAAKEARAAEKIAELEKTVVGLSARLAKLRTMRAEAQEAEAAVKAARTAQELEEAKTAVTTGQKAVEGVKATEQSPGACIPCQEAAKARQEAEEAARETGNTAEKQLNFVDGHPVPEGVDPKHYESLGRDPALAGRFRPNEANTALRVEAKEGVVLQRYQPASSGAKGDWVDPAISTVYDGCSPAPARFFDAQLKNGNYEKSLLEHVNHPTVDRVVIDTTGLGLTPAQMTQLNRMIDSLTPVQKAKILRLP